MKKYKLNFSIRYPDTCTIENNYCQVLFTVNCPFFGGFKEWEKELNKKLEWLKRRDEMGHRVTEAQGEIA